MNEKFKTEIKDDATSVETKNAPNKSSNAKSNLLDDVKKSSDEKIEKSLENGNDNRAFEERGDKEKGEDTSEKSKGTEGEKVEKRGRKKMSDEEKAEAKIKRDSGNSSAKDSLTNDLKSYKTAMPPNAISNDVKKVNEVDVSKYITGTLVLIAMDAIIPNAVIFIAGFIDKKYKGVNKKKLKLTTDEKGELEPLADEVVKIMFGMVHPVTAFLVVTSIIYFGKLTGLDESDFAKPIEKIEKGKKDVK